MSYTYVNGTGEQFNRLIHAGGASLGYNEEGRLSDVNGTAYAFDYEDRLIGVGSTQYFMMVRATGSRPSETV